MRKKGVAVIKLLISGLLLYLVFNRIPFRDVWQVIKGLSPLYLIGALMAFALSKGMAALRLNSYFHSIGIPLTQKSNLKLYLLGMFYNLFLPGGIGGDAYKGYLLNRVFKTPAKRLAQVLILDRISGLILIILYSGLFLSCLGKSFPKPNMALTWGLLIAGFLLYHWGHSKFIPLLQPVFWNSLLYSSGVQLAQLVSIYLILRGMGVTESIPEYLLVFLVSSIVAILPITIGGIGSREITFFYGAQWFGLLEDTSIGVSLIFFAMTAIVSVLGIRYHFQQPELELAERPKNTG